MAILHTATEPSNGTVLITHEKLDSDLKAGEIVRIKGTTNFDGKYEVLEVNPSTNDDDDNKKPSFIIKAEGNDEGEGRNDKSNHDEATLAVKKDRYKRLLRRFKRSSATISPIVQNDEEQPPQNTTDQPEPPQRAPSETNPRRLAPIGCPPDPSNAA